MIRRGIALGAVGLLAMVLVAGVRAPREAEAATAFVWNSADSGAGTFRAAVEAANANPNVNLIVLNNALPVVITSTVTYTGPQTLTIQGNSLLFNRVIEGDGPCARFKATGGGDLTFQRVTMRNFTCDFALEAGIDIEPPANSGEAILKLDRVVLENVGADVGIRFAEPAESSTSFNLQLNATRVSGCADHCVLFDEGGTGGVTASFSTSEVSDANTNGVTAFERGGGDLKFTASGSRFTGHGDVGVNLQEAGTGHLVVSLNGVEIANNEQSGLSASEYDEGDLSITGGVVQASMNNGFGLFGLENGEGNATVNLTAVTALNNLSNGLAFQESDAGDASYTVTGSTSSGSEIGEGLSALEGGEGNLTLWLSSVTLNDNGERGLYAVEAQGGNVSMTILLSRIESNPGTGALVEEDGVGHLTFFVSGSTARDNGSGGNTLDGFSLSEYAEGNLLGSFASSSALDNEGIGYVLDEWGDGALDVTFALSVAAGNGDYGTEGSAEGATGMIRAGSSNVGPYLLNNVLVVP